MNTMIVGLLAFLTLGGTAAMAHDFVASSNADPSCTDLAGQATVCQDISVDPASGVNVDVVADVHPTPPVAATAAAPTCQDLAGHGFVCAEADPSSGVSIDFEVTV